MTKSMYNFYLYCKDFYSIENGIYPIANDELIEKAIRLRYKSKHYQGDTIDREWVRKAIESMQALKECQQ
jgi:hypothetical protein